MKIDAEAALSNLLDIIEARAVSAQDARWWEPVIGADELSPPGLPTFDLVSDDKLVPMTVCEDPS